MKCDWNLIFDILNQAEFYKTSDSIMFLVRTMFNGKRNSIVVEDPAKFNTIYTNILFLQKFGLAKFMLLDIE